MHFTLDTRPAPPRPPLALDDEQRRVVEHRHGPLLDLAGSQADLDAAIDYMTGRGVDVARVEGDIVEG